jgi:spectinomycin phosphotransferase
MWPGNPNELAARAARLFGIDAREVVGLTAGADAEASTYRVGDGDRAHFLKLRRTPVKPGAISLQQHLARVGVAEVLAPRVAELGATQALLYPFVEGSPAITLDRAQWAALGRAVRRIHDTALPIEIAGELRVESFAPTWRAKTRTLLAARHPLLGQHAETIARVLECAEQLAPRVGAKALPLVPCHGDLHAANVLAGERLTIVDWDDPLLAPRERDLMFIGGGVGKAWNMPDEVDEFFAGYGTFAVDLETVAYYRFERIVEDTALFCEQTQDPRTVEFFLNQFLPNGVVAKAFELREASA